MAIIIIGHLTYQKSLSVFRKAFLHLKRHHLYILARPSCIFKRPSYTLQQPFPVDPRPL